MTLNTSEQLLFALLRASLGTAKIEAALFENASPETWKAIYQLAVKQGVTSLALDGMLQLPPTCQPPKAMKLSWAMTVEQHEARYRRYCQAAEELSVYYAQHGIAMVQLKGVGLSSYYPVPQHREGGDIDIYTYAAQTNGKLTDAEANRLADELMEQEGNKVDRKHTYKHSMFYYKGIPVENHKMFLNVKDYDGAAESDALLHRLLNPQEVVLCDEYRVKTPSPAFNTLFLAFHAAQHYGCGLALHHLCDWACLLQRYGLQIPQELKDPYIRQWLLVLTQLCNEQLGTKITLPEACEKELAEEVINEVMHPFDGEEMPKSHWGILCYKTRRLFYMHRLRSRVLKQSLTERLWQSVVWHIKYPQSIFVKK